MRPKRISFSKDDASHIFEWFVMYWQGSSESYGGCHSCTRLAKRLEKLIGPKEVKWVKKTCARFPGVKK